MKWWCQAGMCARCTLWITQTCPDDIDTQRIHSSVTNSNSFMHLNLYGLYTRTHHFAILKRARFQVLTPQLNLTLDNIHWWSVICLLQHTNTIAIIITTSTHHHHQSPSWVTLPEDEITTCSNTEQTRLLNSFGICWTIPLFWIACRPPCLYRGNTLKS